MGNPYEYNCLVSVLMPVYNAESTLSVAIDSILNQTYSSIEFIIINDGSTDDSETIINKYDDLRIKYYANKENRGLIYSLNKGIELASGKYIARMDADDISMPTRIECQVDYMERHPSVIICGTQIELFGCLKIRNRPNLKETNEELKNRLFRRSCFAHPTVMFRRDVLLRSGIRYNSEYKHAEDYKMWIDCVNYGEFYNIQEVLLKYRISESQISSKYNKVQMQIANKCRREYVCAFLREKSILNDIQLNKISVKTIIEAKKHFSIPNELLECLYLSLSKYSLFVYLYFVLSLDFLHCTSWKGSLAVFKRMIINREPLL